MREPHFMRDADASSRAHARHSWQPSLGGWPEGDGARFRVWAPTRQRLDLILSPHAHPQRRVPLVRQDDGSFSAFVAGVTPGDLYMYSPDGEGPFPDPASRWQPHGVHGPSAIVDPSDFEWSDQAWRGVPLDRAVVYELHVGTFTREGTFVAVADRLPYLVDLGVTVLELMPVADFPGARNWGYDGASLFAPSRTYGTPNDLRRLVDRAHQLGLAVLLDVVYNHFGPDGAYAAAMSPRYFSSRHRNAWGAAMNFDGEDATGVREFVIENALHWLHEYHVDGFRLDATHAILDESPRHIVAELTERVKASAQERTILVVGEDDRNLAFMITPVDRGGWGLDALWADDFHHQVRRLAAGDADGYYADYSGSLEDLATTIRSGWFYQGQHSAYRDAPRGTSPAALPTKRMVVCLQNHDQIGNRAFGDRLTAAIDLRLYRALSALLLFVPETPLLFMGQEWAATAPFLYFTDHLEDLGRLVTEGRRAEFAKFEAFASSSLNGQIPDPQAASTFEGSRIDWAEIDRMPHVGVLALYRALIALRGTQPALRPSAPVDVQVHAHASCLLVMRGAGSESLLLVAHLPDRHAPVHSEIRPPGPDWQVVLSSDDECFAAGDRSVTVAPLWQRKSRASTLVFDGPGAVILRPS